ncbi:MAG: MliC family protein [Pseudomonadota bacterium]|nr:MliC family protein [Pseudomonadota bacterium]
MEWIKSLSLLLVVSLMMACTATPPAADETEHYTQDSWQSMIPASCTHFFDGCNKCTRAAGSEMAACTRMACMEYKKPECLDAAAQASGGEQFRCVGDKRFTVYRSTYSSGGQQQTLGQGEIMLVDAQSQRASLLKRVPTGSGERYEGEQDLIFWSKGPDAMVLQKNEPLYRDCSRI